MRNFDDLSEKEVLALAIANEEEDGRIYSDYANALIEEYPSSAKLFAEMAAEENVHRRRLIDLFVSKFGDHIPLIRRQDIRGNIQRRPVWHIKPLPLDKVRGNAREMEQDAIRFYRSRAIAPPTPTPASCSATLRPPKKNTTARRRRSKASCSPPRLAAKRTSNSAGASFCRSSSPVSSA